MHPTPLWTREDKKYKNISLRGLHANLGSCILSCFLCYYLHFVLLCLFTCLARFFPCYCLYPSPLKPVVQGVGATRTSALTPHTLVSLRTLILPKTHHIRAPGRLHTRSVYSRFWGLAKEPHSCLSALSKAFTNPSSRAHVVWILALANLLAHHGKALACVFRPSCVASFLFRRIFVDTTRQKQIKSQCYTEPYAST